MDADTAELVHRAIQVVKDIEGKALKHTLAIGEAMLLLKQSKAWHNMNDCGKSWSKFLASYDLKPQTINNAVRITERFGPIIIKEDIPAVPTRLAACLAIKASDTLSDRDIIIELCSSTVPHDAYSSKIRALKGQPDTSLCRHETKHEYWQKCCDCGKWSEQSKQ